MLKPGHKLGGRYQVIKCLGQGGQSNVYLLKDLRLKGKRWVGKEMTAQYTDPRDQSLARKHFEQEANMLATLEHPNLPKVMDYFSEGGKHYLIMQYLKGEDLGVMLKKSKKPLDEEKVAGWMMQTATVLYYLHCQKPPIIFRDIKPSNIMICQGQVKLIDFGIARHFNPAKKGDTLRIGSPGYSPPEQYSGQTDPRSDIYSMGVTMHHLLTLQDPSTTQTPFKLPPMKIYNKNISPQMVYIVEKATQIEPDKRYPTVLDLKNDLRELAGGGRTVLTSPTTAPTVPHSPISKTVPSGPPQSIISQTGPEQEAPSTKFMPGEGDTGRTEPVQVDLQNPSIPQIGNGKGETGNGKKKKGAMGKIILLFLVIGLAALAYFAVTNPEYVKKFIPYSTPTPSATEKPGSALERGIECYRQGEYREAVIALLKARKEDPDNPEILLHLNSAYAAVSGKPIINIGIILPFSKKKDNPAAKTDEYLSGAALAQREINFAGGVGGKRLGLKICRLTGDRKKDDEILSSFLNSSIVAVADFTGKTRNKKISKIVKSKEIPVVAIKSAQGGIAASKILSWGITGKRLGGALVKTVRIYNPDGVYIIHEKESFKPEMSFIQEELLKANININKKFVYNTDKPDLDRHIDEIKSSGKGALIILLPKRSAIHALSSIHKNRLENRVFLPPDMATGEFLAELGVKPENLVSLSPFYRGVHNYRSNYFISLYKETFDNEPGIKSARGYDIINLMAYAARKSFPESRKIFAFLSSLEAQDGYSGITGNYGGKARKRPMWWAVLESSDGKWKETGGFQY
ncbi:MAG: protein kinase [Candidatus Eremiobacteraeota bacterium]|nr:protein kinase [Candidatus Eremiobacteraeota bacterium]